MPMNYDLWIEHALSCVHCGRALDVAMHKTHIRDAHIPDTLCRIGKPLLNASRHEMYEMCSNDAEGE